MREYKFKDPLEAFRDIIQVYKYAKSPREAIDPMAIIVDREISDETVIVKTNPYGSKTLMSLIKEDLLAAKENNCIIIRPIIGAGFGQGKSACVVMCEEIAKDLNIDNLILVNINLDKFSKMKDYTKIQNEIVLNKLIDKYIKRLMKDDELSKSIRRRISFMISNEEIELSIWLRNNKNFKKIIEPSSNDVIIEENYYKLVEYLMENQAEQINILEMLLKAFSEFEFLNIWLIDEYEKFFDGQIIYSKEEAGIKRATSVLEDLGRFWISYTDVRLMVMITMTDEVIDRIKTEFKGFAEPYFRQVESQNILLKFFTDDEIKKLEQNLIKLFKYLPRAFSDNFEPIDIEIILNEIKREKKNKTPSEFIRRYVEHVLNEYNLTKKKIVEPEFQYQELALEKFKQILKTKYADPSKGVWKNFEGKSRSSELKIGGHPIDLNAEFISAKKRTLKRAFGEATTTTHLDTYINNLFMTYEYLKEENFVNNNDLLFFFTPSEYISSKNKSNLKYNRFEYIELNLPERLKEDWEKKFKKKRKKKKIVTKKKPSPSTIPKKKPSIQLIAKWGKLNDFLEKFFNKAPNIDEMTLKQYNFPISKISRLCNIELNFRISKKAKEYFHSAIAIIAVEVAKEFMLVRNEQIKPEDIEGFSNQWDLDITQHTGDFVSNAVVKRFLENSKKKISRKGLYAFQSLLKEICLQLLSSLKDIATEKKRMTIQIEDISAIFKEVL